MATSNILLFCFLLLLGSHLSASLPTGPGPHPGNLLRSTSGPEPPSNDPFYTPDGSSWTTLKPGTILKQRSITVPSFANATATAPGLANVEHAYQLLYSSTDVFGRPDYMVTTVLVPANANIQHHLSYQVAYDAVSYDCAPSYGIQSGSSTHAGLAQSEFGQIMSYFLAQGAIVSVPDYEGRHSAFTVGPQAARGTLNSIRAVLSSGSFTSISPSASTVMWGYSGGALASEWAGELHKSYAPELKIIGAAIGGFPTNISKTALAVEGKDNAGIAAASILGIAGTFPDFDKYLKAHIRPESSSVFYLPRTLCNWDQTDPSYGYLPSLRNQSIATFFDNGLTFLTDFAPLIDSVGTMGHYGTPTFPLFVWKGTKDQIAVPIEDTDALVAKYCAEGTNIAYQRYVGAKHVQAGGLGAGPAIRFLLGLLGGATPPKKCSITDIQVSK